MLSGAKHLGDSSLHYVLVRMTLIIFGLLIYLTILKYTRYVSFYYRIYVNTGMGKFAIPLG
jgi:hypothetical protein